MPAVILVAGDAAPARDAMGRFILEFISRKLREHGGAAARAAAAIGFARQSPPKKIKEPGVEPE